MTRLDLVKFLVTLMILIVAAAILVVVVATPGLQLWVRIVFSAMLGVIIVRILLWYYNYFKHKANGSRNN